MSYFTRRISTVFLLWVTVMVLGTTAVQAQNASADQSSSSTSSAGTPDPDSSAPAGIKHYVPFMNKFQHAKEDSVSRQQRLAKEAKEKDAKKAAQRLAKFKEKYAVHFTIDTDKGTMAGVLYTQEAPITTANFIKLAEAGFYNGLTFHRVERDFVIQTGDPTGTGSGGSPDRIPLEIHDKLRHDDAGVLGMARTNDPNSASSQFYITLAPTPFLDDKYAVFGKLTEGVDIARSISKGDHVTRITIQKPATP